MTVKTSSPPSGRKLTLFSPQHLNLARHCPSSRDRNRASTLFPFRTSTNKKQRNARATSQIILLPGNDRTSAESFVADGSGPALATVTNPDGTTTNLVFDIHKYLDSDGSGTSPDCVGNYISVAFAPLAQWLRCNGRMALLVSFSYIFVVRDIC